ncbi:MAG: hypothetical protein ACM3VT_18400 [Solirubrobacterales bacterium]
MQKTSIRTLVLLLELFAAVASLQYFAAIRPARAGAVWLAGNCTTSQPAPAVDDSIGT